MDLVKAVVKAAPLVFAVLFVVFYAMFRLVGA